MMSKYLYDVESDFKFSLSFLKKIINFMEKYDFHWVLDEYEDELVFYDIDGRRNVVHEYRSGTATRTDWDKLNNEYAELYKEYLMKRDN